MVVSTKENRSWEERHSEHNHMDRQHIFPLLGFLSELKITYKIYSTLNISVNTLFDLDILMIPPVTFSRSRMLSLVLSLTTSILVFFLKLAAGDTYPVGVKAGTLRLEPRGRGRLELFILGALKRKKSSLSLDRLGS